MLGPVSTAQKSCADERISVLPSNTIWRKYLILQIQVTWETWKVFIIYKQRYFQQNLFFQTFAHHVNRSTKTEGARGISPLRVRCEGFPSGRFS